MCYALTLPLICALQTVSRVFISALFAAEDLIRLVIHTVHSYLSSILYLFSFVPICLGFCFARQCFCSGFRSSGCYPKYATSCSCTIVIILTTIVILVLYYTFWLEDLLDHVKIKLPCIIFRKTRNKEVIALREKYENKTNDKALHTSVRYPDIWDNNEKQEMIPERAVEGTNHSNAFTKVEYLIPNEHHTMQQMTEPNVDYFNLADSNIRVPVGNETEITRHTKETRDYLGNRTVNRFDLQIKAN